MTRFRPRTLRIHLVLVSLVLAGCGGGKTEQSRTPAPAGHSATPQPSYAADQVKTALLEAKDLGSNARPQTPNFPGPDRGAAPSCSLSRIKLPGKPTKVAQQFGSAASRFTDPNFNQLIAIYTQPAEGVAAFAAVRKKLAACPAKQHIPQKKISGNRITLAHNDTWKLTTDTISGWSHLRGFEKHVEPPSTSVINVYYLIYDFAARGNVLVTSVYWQRVKAKASGEPVAKRATALLTKQLQKIG